ncbi:ABC transporter ATP-binding protein [Rhodococcus sp. ACS1]|uniref:ABC transporter ATP-binding protein n=1 Tax=Rhodococcus sp. ACS1 TaxID=2028570 RepID=UPI00211C1A75|nr:ABC transporter ATP-binding protein [Rhodococcus sp. ACS1]
MPEPETAVRVSGLRKTFHRRREAVHALKALDLEVARGELLVLLGPSGCGKTTFLRCLVGMERPTQGTISLEGDPVVDAECGLFAPPNRRNVGMVFQNYALWPHMKVRDNVAYPLKARKLKDALSEGRVDEVLQVVQCSHLADRYPPELSGGQQQRVSLARALAAKPALLLLDEPLSNLDALLRIDLRAQLRELHRTLGFTGVYVTHDQEEALALGTRVAVMNEGEIVQIGPPRDVYRRPATEKVADFLGARNVFQTRVGAEVLVNDQSVSQFAGRWTPGAYSLRLRPSQLLLRSVADPTGDPDTGWLSNATVVEVLPGIDRHEYVVSLKGERYLVDLPVSGREYAVGAEVEIGLPAHNTLCYGTDGVLVPELESESTRS